MPVQGEVDATSENPDMLDPLHKKNRLQEPGNPKYLHHAHGRLLSL